VQEGVLRRSFLKNGEYLDQALWTILEEEWRDAKAIWGPGIVVH
jgi:RimJ/RimL family protein N-acetyltransferase